ncbi:hypothetical protein WICPIJ_003227 [Wickerhamomyces pijperi]|uniref:Peptide chain release factor 1, mitochondrial n=1 Tax=Wickerhamomyces pijperi TaxID=599730 RepID=A0A9P8Q9Z2_WICPI|nr:hypothetical protein WICPIJ_003227 [Wickerhamomyces pijperi]
MLSLSRSLHRSVSTLRRHLSTATTATTNSIESDYTHAIIGGGVIGLSIATTLASQAGNRVLLLEKNHKLGQETTSRNSEVIHAGLYYPADSLKTQLCIEGKHMIYELAKSRKSGIEVRKCGKWIVAQTDYEDAYIEHLHYKAKELGVKTELIPSYKASMMEPAVKALRGVLSSPTSGIISSESLMAYLEAEFQDSEAGDIVLGAKVVGLAQINGKEGSGFEITVESGSSSAESGGDIELSSIKVDNVVNSAGLYADKIANMLLPAEKHMKLYYGKGTYFSYNSSFPEVRRLIYPVPPKNVKSLGTHLTIDMEGQIRFGPDLRYVDSPLDLNPDEVDLREFHDQISRYLDHIMIEDLSPAYCGIRPKLNGPDDSEFKDFHIKEEPGFKGFVNLVGMESPGLTSALAIGRYVRDIYHKIRALFEIAAEQSPLSVPSVSRVQTKQATHQIQSRLSGTDEPFPQLGSRRLRVYFQVVIVRQTGNIAPILLRRSPQSLESDIDLVQVVSPRQIRNPQHQLGKDHTDSPQIHRLGLWGVEWLCGVPGKQRRRPAIISAATTLRLPIHIRLNTTDAAIPSLDPTLQNFQEIHPSLLQRAQILSSELTQLESAISSGSGFDLNQQKKFSQLSAIVDVYNDYIAQLSNFKELQLMIQEEGQDPTLLEEATSELQSILPDLIAITSKLQSKLLPPHPFADHRTLIELRPGIGGVEAMIFTSDLLQMYTSFCMLNRWKHSIISKTVNQQGNGITEAILSIDEPSSYDTLRFESGVHRVQRIPETESKGRVQTSTAAVVVLPQMSESGASEDADERAFAQGEVRIDVMRASGKGGQHVNTTESAVRLTHIPSGIVVSIQDERSQHKNKAKAFTILRARLAELDRLAHEAEERDKRKEQVSSTDRSDKIRTYNFPQNRVTDHRVSGLSVHDIEGVMRGERLAGIIDVLREDEGKRKSKELLEELEREQKKK